MDEVTKAMGFAAKAHSGVKDKNGRAFIGHPLRTAAAVAATVDPLHFDVQEAVTMALLHDVVEDTETTLDDLLDAGFSGSVVRAVDLLTRRKGITYFDYVRRIADSGNCEAMLVKMADICDNLRPERKVEGHDLTKRYTKALLILMNGLAKTLDGQ